MTEPVKADVREDPLNDPVFRDKLRAQLSATMSELERSLALFNLLILQADDKEDGHGHGPAHRRT